jgi:hypothetical protein
MKKTLLISLLLLSCIGLVACSNQKQEDSIEALFVDVKITQLSVEPLPIKSEEIGLVGNILCIDNLLVTSTMQPIDYCVTLYDLHTGAVANHLARKGKARDEFLYVMSIDQFGDSLVITTGGSPGRVSYIPRNQLFEQHPEQKSVLLDYSEWSSLNTFLMGGKDRYITVGWSTSVDNQDQFGIFDSTGVFKYSCGDYVRSEEQRDFRNFDIAMGYQGHVRTTLDKNHGLYFGGFHGILKFFDFTGEKPQEIKQYVFFLPRLHPMSDPSAEFYRVAHVRPIVKGTLDVTADEHHYYVLYSGETFEEGSNASKMIYVFDVQGNPKRKIALDQSVEQIAYWEQRHALVAYHEDEVGEPYFVLVNLNEIK